MKRRSWRVWLRAATRPRLLGALALLVIGAVVCALLGAWQWDRAQARGAQAAAIEQAERVSADPVPLESVVGPQTQLVQEMVGVQVRVEGRYRSQHQFLVVAREHDGEAGFWVLTALEITEGEFAGTVLPVVRGWTADDDPASIPAVPDGVVEVVGYLAPGEGAGTRLPQAHLMDAVSPAQLVNVWGGPIYSAYVAVISQEPPGSAVLAPIGPPHIEDAGLNLRNLAYAIEWWIFGGFALFLWWRLVRDEVRHIRGEVPEGPLDGVAEDAPSGSVEGEPSDSTEDAQGGAAEVVGSRPV